jgi:phosphatidylserine/phosphatidylglycerophosphate/cardiolipin synthase-like enzyme
MYLVKSMKWAALLLAVALGACTGALPDTATPRSIAEKFFGTLNPKTAIDALVHDRDIHPPDPSSATPLLEQLRRELEKTDPTGSFRGVTYDLTTGNLLEPNWIVQSPNWWGRRAADLPFYPLQCKDQNCAPDVALPYCQSDADCGGGTCGTIWPAAGTSARRRVCFGHSDAMIVGLHDLVAGARHTVDITLLQPAPDMRFLAALRTAIADLARSGRPIAIRVLIGQYPPDEVDASALLGALTADARNVSNGHLKISVAAMRSCETGGKCDSFSWNHSKIVSIDGRDALVGGHNMWSEDYLIDNPVHDLSMRVHGPAAASASRFADAMWRYVCAKAGMAPTVTVVSFESGESAPGMNCPSSFASVTSSNPGKAAGVSILAIGRLAGGLTRYFDNQGDLARDLMFGAAQTSIRIVQQDIGFILGRADAIYPESTLERLVDFLETKQGDIYIVLSNQGSMGNSGFAYYNGVPLRMLAKHLRDMVSKRYEARRADKNGRLDTSIRRGPDPVNAMLCSRVHLAPYRFGPDKEWPGGKTIANHSKFWMVDDRVFYIGSDNLYPVDLQEFGYIVDDRRAAADILETYWNPVWQWSQRAAVSGEGVEHCIFRDVANR